jgi:hypothetical protein
MAWFNNMLYVGTGREPNCVTAATSAIQLGRPVCIRPPSAIARPDYHDLPLQAEIWQYNPATNIWTMVFQSPNSLSTVDNAGQTVATAWDIGFRGLTWSTNRVAAVPAPCTPAGSLPESYSSATPLTSHAIALPQGSWPPPRILRTTDGVNWARFRRMAR